MTEQYQENHPDSLQNESRTSHTSTHSTTGTTAQPTSFRTFRPSTAMNERMTTGTLIQNIVQLTTSFRTTTPTEATTGRTNTSRTTPNTMTKNRSIQHRYFKICHITDI